MRIFVSIALVGLLQMTLYSQRDTVKAQAAMEKGLDLYANKSYQIALETFQASAQYYEAPDTNLAKLYHRIYACHFYLGDLDSTLYYVDKTIFAYSDALGRFNEKVLPILANKGYIQGRMGLEEEEYNTYLERLSIARGTFGDKSYEAGVALYDLGRQVSIDLGKISKGIAFYEEGLGLMLHAKGDEDKMVAWTYENLGLLYGYMGYEEKSLDYCEKAHFIKKKLYDTDVDLNIGRSYINIGAQLHDLGQFEKARTYFEKGIEILEKTGNRKHQLMGMGYDGLGLIEKELGNYEKAEDYALKAIPIHENNLNSDDVFIIESYLNLYTIYWEQGEHETALKYLQKAQKIANQYGHRLEPSITALIGKWHSRNQDFLRARQAFQLAYYKMGIENLDGRQYLGTPDFSKVELIKDNVELVFENGESLVQQFKSNPRDSTLLKDAYQAYQLADTLLGQLTQRGFGYKPALIELQKRIHARIIALAAYGLLRPKAVFPYFEKNKARQLLESLRKSKAKTFLNISEGLLSQEADFKQRIGFLEKRLFEYRRDEEGEAAIEGVQDKLFNLKNEFEKFQEKLKREAPKYYQLQYNAFLLDVDFVQQALSKEEVLLEYFLEGSDLYTLIVSKEEVRLVKQELPNHFEDTIQSFRSQLSDWKNASANLAEAQEKFSEQAFELYRLLVQKPLKGEASKQLLIIPDALLSYIPFEVLIEEESKADFRKMPYLLREYTIQYAYSSAVYLEQIKRKSTADKDFLGFAPSYQENTYPRIDDQTTLAQIERSGYYQLLGAEEEVSRIAGMLNGDFFVEQQASERVFKEQSNRYKVLHLSMHGVVEDEDPLFSKLLFTQVPDTLEDNILYAYELYNMDLEADLAVLSACNTGLGELQSGEGVISLSHAFSYAGVPSTILSLWKIPDQTSADLMTLFYENIKKEKTKPNALRQAKLQYLNQIEAVEQAHPYFWGAFIGYGNPSPVLMKTQWHWWLWGSVLILMTVFFFFIKNRKTV